MLGVLPMIQKHENGFKMVIGVPPCTAFCRLFSPSTAWRKKCFLLERVKDERDTKDGRDVGEHSARRESAFADGYGGQAGALPKKGRPSAFARLCSPLLGFARLSGGGGVLGKHQIPNTKLQPRKRPGPGKLQTGGDRGDGPRKEVFLRITTLFTLITPNGKNF
jgi:hypothetical protein